MGQHHPLPASTSQLSSFQLKIRFLTPIHGGQATRAEKCLIEGVKRMLDRKRSLWDTFWGLVGEVFLPGLFSEVLEGAWLMRATIHKNWDGLSAMKVAAQQLDSIIDTIDSKDFKQSLFDSQWRQPSKVMELMETIAISGRPKSVVDVIAYN